MGCHLATPAAWCLPPSPHCPDDFFLGRTLPKGTLFTSKPGADGVVAPRPQLCVAGRVRGPGAGCLVGSATGPTRHSPRLPRCPRTGVGTCFLTWGEFIIKRPPPNELWRWPYYNAGEAVMREFGGDRPWAWWHAPYVVSKTAYRVTWQLFGEQLKSTTSEWRRRGCASVTRGGARNAGRRMPAVTAL